MIWPDVARGVGIVLVVVGHVIAGLLNLGVLHQTPSVQWTYFAIYAFHMPLFFFLSGLFVPIALRRGAEDFLAGKLWTLVYPYVLWSLLQGVIQMSMVGVLGTPHSVTALTGIGWQPISQFWFLYALILCHLFVVLVRAHAIVLVTFGVVGAVAAHWLPFTWIIAKTLHFLIYYALGVVLAAYALRLRAAPWWAAAAAIVAFAVFTALGGGAASMRAESLWVAPAAFAGVAATVALALRMPDVLGAGLAWLGRASMTILVLHILVIVSLRMALAQEGVDNPAVHLALGIGLGLGVPALAHFWLDRIGALPLFGFARPPRAPAPVSA